MLSKCGSCIQYVAGIFAYDTSDVYVLVWTPAVKIENATNMCVRQLAFVRREVVGLII